MSPTPICSERPPEVPAAIAAGLSAIACPPIRSDLVLRRLSGGPDPRDTPEGELTADSNRPVSSEVRSNHPPADRSRGQPPNDGGSDRAFNDEWNARGKILGEALVWLRCAHASGDTNFDVDPLAVEFLVAYGLVRSINRDVDFSAERRGDWELSPPVLPDRRPRYRPFVDKRFEVTDFGEAVVRWINNRPTADEDRWTPEFLNATLFEILRFTGTDLPSLEAPRRPNVSDVRSRLVGSFSEHGVVFTLGVVRAARLLKICPGSDPAAVLGIAAALDQAFRRLSDTSRESLQTFTIRELFGLLPPPQADGCLRPFVAGTCTAGICWLVLGFCAPEISVWAGAVGFLLGAWLGAKDSGVDEREHYRLRLCREFPDVRLWAPSGEESHRMTEDNRTAE